MEQETTEIREVIDARHSAAFMRFMVRMSEQAESLSKCDIGAACKVWHTMGSLQVEFYGFSCLGELL